MESYNLVSLAGIFIIIAFAWLLSPQKKQINWQLLFWGIGLQFIFAAFIFWVPFGSKFFLFINDLVVKVLESAAEGTKFVFGPLALPPGATDESGAQSIGFIFAFQALPSIVFFSALVNLLYYFNVMPRMIKGFSWLFTKLMRLSGVESLCAASNIFVGIEAPITIQPYLKKATNSELHTILSVCMATIASTVLAMYVFMLKDYFPTIAGHLVSASILSAPAALVISKMLFPETEKPETLGLHVDVTYGRENNPIEAIIKGSNTGVKLAASVAGMLLAFLGLVALVDLFLGSLGGLFNSWTNVNFEWTLKNILGYVFYPFTLVIGIPISDAMEIARLIGERLIVTELTAYQDLAMLLKNQVLEHPRSSLIATYALCGFAHIASLAIFLGGVSVLAPSRTNDLSRIAPRALLTATLACLLTAAVAGTFFYEASILLSH